VSFHPTPTDRKVVLLLAPHDRHGFFVGAAGGGDGGKIVTVGPAGGG
jgi:hypothetical protein